MRDAGLTGVVPVEALIGSDGAVSSVRVLSAQVHPDFAIAAVDAVRQWRFTPTLLNGVPVEVVMTVSFGSIWPTRTGVQLGRPRRSRRARATRQVTANADPLGSSRVTTRMGSRM